MILLMRAPRSRVSGVWRDGHAGRGGFRRGQRASVEGNIQHPTTTTSIRRLCDMGRMRENHASKIAKRCWQ
jgi:hypothetical protein